MARPCRSALGRERLLDEPGQEVITLNMTRTFRGPRFQKRWGKRELGRQFRLPSKDPLAREFQSEMCRVERWVMRTLR